MPWHRKLALATGALALLQVAHLLDALRYDATATLPSVLSDPATLLAVAVTIGASVACLLRLPGFDTVAALVGGLATIGFIVQHGIPIDLGTNNPYWGTADAIQWAIVIAVIATGALAFWIAVDPPRDARSRSAQQRPIRARASRRGTR